MPKETLKTTLHPISNDDCERVWLWRNREDVRRYMYDQHEIQWADHQRWFDRMIIASNSVYWIIAINGIKAGVACLVNIDQNHHRASWAFYIGEPHLRGAGAGAIVEYFVTDYGFNTLNLNRIECEVLAWNTPIIRMHQKFGFRHEGTKKDYIIHNGEAVDVLCFGMLQCEWHKYKSNNLNRLKRAGIDISTLI